MWYSKILLEELRKTV